MTTNEPESDPPKQRSFVRLLMQHDRVIRAYLRGALPTANDVDEVMQEVSVVAWRKFHELDHPDNFRRWACVIAKYEILMHRRQKARDRFVLTEDIERLMADEGLEELSIRAQQLAALEGCLNKLPPKKRELVLRVYESAAPMKTIAAQIGKSPEALYKLVSRMRHGLLECVARTMLEEQR